MSEVIPQPEVTPEEHYLIFTKRDYTPYSRCAKHKQKLEELQKAKLVV